MITNLAIFSYTEPLCAVEEMKSFQISTRHTHQISIHYRTIFLLVQWTVIIGFHWRLAEKKSFWVQNTQTDPKIGALRPYDFQFFTQWLIFSSLNPYQNDNNPVVIVARPSFQMWSNQLCNQQHDQCFLIQWNNLTPMGLTTMLSHSTRLATTL